MAWLIAAACASTAHAQESTRVPRDEPSAAIFQSTDRQPIELTIGASAPWVKQLEADQPLDEGEFRADRPALSVDRDLDTLACDFWHDVESVWTCENALFLLAAGAASLVAHESIDDDVAEWTGRHPNRWGKGQEFFSAIGNPGHHFTAIGMLYGYSLYTQNVEAHELSKSLFGAVAITGISTALLKAASGNDTMAPNGEPDPFGGSWPSGHTSSSFAFAAVLNEYYGPKVGLPAFFLAGLVGWERIDDREHHLSDVIFGAALGYVIGRSVAAEHRTRLCGLEFQPYVDPATGTAGLAAERRF
jgi:membrane-associated phospholipid phosphatase